MQQSRFSSTWFPLCTLVVALLALVQLTTAHAATTDLLISEYIEGSSNNKAIEIYNGTGAAIDLAAGGYNIQMYFNGGASAGLTLNLTGSVADGDVYVVAHASANATILAQADQTNGAGWFNGDDAIVLRKGTTVLDVIGQIGVDPGTEWGSGVTSTADNTLHRKATICTGDPNGDDVFDPNPEWDGFAVDTFTGLGTHIASCDGSPTDTAPSVTATSPTNGATDVALNANLAVTFSEPVTVSGAWYTISCTLSGSHTATVSGGPTAFTLDPSADFAQGESCTVTILAANVSDQDAIDPPDTLDADVVFSFATTVPISCDAAFTPIYQIQGAGNAPAITGGVTTQGVVVGDYEGPSPALRGFYLQDVNGDGDPTTSDGIFVFNGNNDSVSLGQVVRVVGTVSEFQDQTQINLSSVSDCGTTANPAPVDITLPFPAPVGGVEYLERFEGMLVRFPQTLYVTEFFQLGRFGQIVMSSGDRLYQPTHIAEPGAAAQFEQSENNLNRIIVDDALQNQNPDPILFGRGGNPLSASNPLRGGDTATGMVGIMSYTWAGNAASGNAYRLRPIGALGGGVPNFQAGNARPVAAPSVGGSLQVASLNVLNYFLTLGTGVQCGPTGALECRGAENAQEFSRQREKLLQALIKIDAGILGLVELENSTGVEPLADIVAGLNDAFGANTYAYIDTGTIGTDAIKVGLIYKPAVVTPVGAPLINNAGVHNRPPLAQTFAQGDARFTVIVNHFKSKGCGSDGGGDADSGDGQGCYNARRTLQAEALVDFINTTVIPTAGDSDVLLLGDFNSYAKEEPIDVLTAAGFVDLVGDFGGPEAYSYVFDGQWGYLDYALASASLYPQVSGAADYHINADEPSVLDYNTNFKSAGQIADLYAPDEFRTSDHDPILVGLGLTFIPPTITLTKQVINDDGGTAGPNDFGLTVNGAPVISGEAVAVPSGTPVAINEAGLPGYTFVSISGDAGCPTVLGGTVTLGVGETLHCIITNDDEPAPPAADVLMFSFNLNGSIKGLTFRDEDILAYDPSSGTWSILFDGSNVGLGNADVDAIAMRENGNLLLSVTLLTHLPSVGIIDGTDILEFVPTSLGANNTSGSFEIFFDGSDVGLLPLIHDVDAIDFDAEGNLLISVRGPFFAQGVLGNDEDLFRLRNGVFGPNTSGNWELAFDGSDVGLSTLSEDTRDTWTDTATGEIYLTNGGNFRTNTNFRGKAWDVFICDPISLGPNTACTFSLYFDGQANSLSGKRIDGFHIGPLPGLIGAAGVLDLALDNTVEYPGDDADPVEEVDGTSEPDEVFDEPTVEQNYRLFLPLVGE